ncbi:LOW QUALITY PROTEIN: ras GTPase-activating-like protein IQGAP3 [Nematolebias whitei]|uniref:LOW QUALITY PROTEIN: ras GTPase-activating-like protein IQGAP3 n=1 Tax=Nematolebias whitei TaxID=451745 RepID=UPI001899A665|nr:LOW QUALITY PROTEIN: ras GTPase-activating-like protein IQGAP3 [Nematolebias whitei]
MSDSIQNRYEHLTAEQMDEQRIQNMAYQYLCRLEEAKRWMETCLGAELPASTELEEALRNGVVLAKLGHQFAPTVVPLKKIFDPELLRYQAAGLQFRHTDNINHWRNAMTSLGLPAIFHPETTDVYDKKNMPRAVYCLHALSLYLYRLGLAPPIHDLYGKVKFTEEEINNMKLELDKYGIQMPAFNKIGGLLANELSLDEAAAHAAVIAINKALDRGDVGKTAVALRNPAALLIHLQEVLMSSYQEVLQEARRRKAEGAAGKGGGSEDMYEEYLTQREIQQHIDAVNVRSAVEQVDEALDAADELAILSALQLSCLALRGLHTENGPWYLDQLLLDRQQKALDQGSVDPLEPVELQESISAANQEAQGDRTMLVAMQRVNSSLRGNNPQLTLTCLMTSDLLLPEVFPSAATLYHHELQQLQRQAAQGELQQEELFVAVEMLSAVALINQALEARHVQKFSSSLVSPSVGLSDVDHALMNRYLQHLAGEQQQLDTHLLTWNQLQEGVQAVNTHVQDEHQKLLAVELINKAVRSGSVQQLMSALMLPSCGMEEVLPANACQYLTLLTGARQHKAQVSREPGAALWLADIQEVVKLANQQSQKALKLSLAVAAVNQAVKENQVQQTLRVLSLPELELRGLLPDCAADYQRELRDLLTDRKHSGNTHVSVEQNHVLSETLTQALCSGENRSSWVQIRLNEGSFYYFHLKRLEGSWERPDAFKHNGVFIDQHEIQAVVSVVLASYNRSVLWQSSNAIVTCLQARCRGFLIRRQLEARHRYLTEQTPAVVIIQSHWRRWVQQRAFRWRLQFLHMNWRAVVTIQAFVKMWLQKKKYLGRLNFFRQNVDAVIKIQAFFRASRARHEYRMLVCSDNPPLSVLRKFLHLLDLGDCDMREEVELLRLREEVVRSIHFNRELEADLNLMDLKIGLLVRNRATLQEVVSQCKKLTKKNKEHLSDLMDVERTKGLKALSRDRRDRLEAYQHLFYLLQTQPLYLAQVIFLMPQSGSTSFMERLVFSLFNYGSDRREAFLLLQLFTEALQYEIRLKVTQPQDVVTGNPTVFKMLVNFYRHARGHNALRDFLGPALKDILLDRTLITRTDPVEVYKAWINQIETQTGHKSPLPYDVSPEDALSHPEVQRRIDIAILNLKNLTGRVLKAITSNLNKLPYGLRYSAKVLRDTLKTKFPTAGQEELYKIVGNLVYYRYMNPAIVAPDVFDVVDRSAGSTLQPEQRHLLGSISRLLQHAAANKSLHGDGYQVQALNQYIGQMHSKFRRFLQSVCDVPEPEDKFCMDKFSELLIVNRPVIYISVSDLLNVHQLLFEHQDVVCPDPSDLLRLILEDLGPVSTLQELIGESSADPGSEFCNLEISLTLSNKFDIFNESNDKADARGLLLSTKQLITDVIRTQPGDSLSDILRKKTSPGQEVHHDWLMKRRAQQDAQTPEKMKKNQSLVANSNLSLLEKKRKILRSLRCLEGLGVLRPPQAENQILQMIAKDIRQLRLHRQHRGVELLQLRQTLCRLQEKSTFHSEQVDYYKHYITSCLENLTANSRSAKKKKTADGGGRTLPALSYSAARLQEKGVLLEIQDLPHTQFKNVVFNILPGPRSGSFRVKAQFLGVEMEEFLLQYQDLLQLQYEGVAVMKMFDTAKVNVNLLIFLLNKKFFKK